MRFQKLASTSVDFGLSQGRPFFAFAMQSYCSFRLPPNFLPKKTKKILDTLLIGVYIVVYKVVGCNVAATLIAAVARMATAISIHVTSFRWFQHIHAHTAVAAVYAGKAHISGRSGLSAAVESTDMGPTMPVRATHTHISVSHHGRGCRVGSFIFYAFYLVFYFRGMQLRWLRCRVPARIAA